jgi:hypothetical protein
MKQSEGNNLKRSLSLFYFIILLFYIFVARISHVASRGMRAFFPERSEADHSARPTQLSGHTSEDLSNTRDPPRTMLLPRAVHVYHVSPLTPSESPPRHDESPQFIDCVL